MTVEAHQPVKKYENINFAEIMPLFDYHPWQDGKNPRIDNITHTILNLKSNEDCARRRGAVKYFTKVLTDPYKGLFKFVDGKPCMFAVVPSHCRGSVSGGLMELVSNLSSSFKFSNEENVLLRYTTVIKAATGGARSIRVHLESIRVIDDVQGKTVYLFDDIASTGSSLEACKQLLLEAGAERVAMVALGRTYMVT